MEEYIPSGDSGILFKQLGERITATSSFKFPVYDPAKNKDFIVSLATLTTYLATQLGVSSKAVFELTGVTNTSNDYVSTLDISEYKTEALYIFKPSEDSDGVTTLDINNVGDLPIRKFNGTTLVDVDDLKTVNTYVLLNKTTYWLIVGGASGGSGGVSTFSALTDSPYDNTLLAEALNSKQDKPNGVLTGCIITLGSYGGSGSNNDIRVTEGTWRISPSEYGNIGSGNTDFLDIALSASGLQRYVELVGTTSNTIIKIEGSESEIAVRPTLSTGQVSLGSILVKDALIDPPVPDLSGYVPLAGTSNISGSLFFNNSGREIGRDGKSSIKFNDTQIYANVQDGDNQAYITPSIGGGNANVNLNTIDKNDATRNRSFNVTTGQAFSVSGDIIKYDVDRTTEIDVEPRALIDRGYADAHYTGGGAFDPTVDQIGDITPSNTPIVDNDTVTVFAGKTQGQLNEKVDKEDFTSVTFATPLNLDCANKQNPLFKVPSVNTDFTLNMTNVKSGANGLIKLFITTASAVTVTFDSDFTNESQNTVLAPFTFPAGTGKEYFMSFIVDGTTIEWVIIDGRLNIAAGADNNIIVFNASTGNWEAVAVSGDLTNILGAFTVADNVITFAKFQQMAANTVLGNPNGVTADAEEMTTVEMFVTDSGIQTSLNTEAGWSGGVKTGITGLLAGQFYAGFNLTDTDYYYEYSCQVNGTGIRKLATKGVKYDTLAVKTPVANKSANYTSTVNDHELNFTASATLTLHAASSSDGQELVYGTTGAAVTVTIVGTVNGGTPTPLATQYSFQRIKSVNGIWVNR